MTLLTLLVSAGLPSARTAAQDVRTFAAEVRKLASEQDGARIPLLAREECEALARRAAETATAAGLDGPRVALSGARTYADCLTERRGTATLVAPAGQVEATRELLQPDIARAETAVKEAETSVEFMGLSWGVGFGASYALERVEEGEIVGTTVRVTRERRWQPRAVFEFHKFLIHDGDARTPASRGNGPFLAVAATEDKLLSGVGAGWIWGWKSLRTDPDGFCFALGVILDGKVKSLAKGFEDGRVPPNGEAAVRYLEKARPSALAFVTRSF